MCDVDWADVVASAEVGASDCDEGSVDAVWDVTDCDWCVLVSVEDGD